MGVRLKFRDAMLNSGRIIELYAGRTRLRTFLQYLFAFGSRPEVANDVVSGSFMGLTVRDYSV